MDEGISYSDSVYCQDAINPTPTMSPLTNGYFYSDSSLVIDSCTGYIDLAASDTGSHLVYYESYSGSSEHGTALDGREVNDNLGEEEK